MPRTRFVLNRRGQQELLKAKSTRRVLHDRAERMLAAAKAAAPYDNSPGRDPNKPHYRDNLRIVDDTTDRAVVRVVAGVDHALAVEATFGTLNRSLRQSK